MNTSDSTKHFIQQNIASNNVNVLPTQNKNVYDGMVLCYFNVRPKLKYKHICNLINELQGAPPLGVPYF